MGLLDDAIREHLDLKRRRGADPADVERAERDALGPVQRNREAPEATEVDESEGGGGFAYDHDAEDDWAHDSPAPPPPVGADADPSPHGFEDEIDVAEPLAAPRAPEPLPPATPSPTPVGGLGGGGETVEYDVERALGSGEPTDEDVLEETPEFLQDTPDHDRLWFEQRPPRDFDFEG